MSVLNTVGDIQRYAAACVRYANELSDYKYRVEFHTVEDDHRFEMLKARGQAGEDERPPKYYTYFDEKANTVVIHVPNPTTATSERDARIIKAGILHEILHTAEGTHAASEEIVESGIGKLDKSSPLAHIFNIIEDHRIERLDCEKFEGDAHVLRQAYEIISEEFTKQVTDGGFDLGTLQESTLKVMGVSLTDHVAREPWMNIGHVTEDQFAASHDISKEVARKLVDKDYDDRIREVETVGDAISLSKEIFEELFEEDADEHCEQNQQQQQSGSEAGESGSDDDKEGQGDSREGTGGDGDAGKGSTGGSKQEVGSGDGDTRDIPVDDFDYLEYLRKHKSVPNTGTEPPKDGMHIDYTKYLESGETFDEFDPCPMESIGVANYGANYFKPTGSGENIERLVARERTGRGGREDIDAVFESHGLQVNSLANKIRRLLQVNSQARWVGGSTSGRIHRKSAYRAALPTVGDGRWNREIFKRRHQDSTLDVAVSILCDFSGSMGGAKMAHATFGGFILSDSIGRVLRIPTQVQTFSEHGDETVICVLKNWNEVVSENEFKSRAARSVWTMGSNDDGSAIVWTYNDLIRRPEKRKVMIVLSDGQPASCRSGDEMKYTQDVVRDIQEEGRVEMYGIGIRDRNVTLIYKENETINRVDDIESAILNTIKRKLIP